MKRFRTLFGLFLLCLLLAYTLRAGGQTLPLYRSGTLYNASAGTLSVNLYTLPSMRAGDVYTLSFRGLARLVMAVYDKTTLKPALYNNAPIRASYTAAWPADVLTAIRSTYTFSLKLPVSVANGFLVVQNPDAASTTIAYTLQTPQAVTFVAPPLGGILSPTFTRDSVTGQTVITYKVYNQGSFPCCYAVQPYDTTNGALVPLTTLPQSFCKVGPNSFSQPVSVAFPASVQVISLYVNGSFLGVPLPRRIYSFKVVIQ